MLSGDSRYDLLFIFSTMRGTGDVARPVVLYWTPLYFR